MSKIEEQQNIKSRRARNEGSVRWLEEKGIYQARYSAGIGENGRTVYKSICGKKKTGPGGVMEQMRDAISELGKGSYVEPSNVTLLAYCKQWYETYKKPNIRINTKLKYEISLKRLKRYSISATKLKDLVSENLQKFYNQLSADDLSEATIRITHSVINGALEHAEETKRIIKNPARKLSIPKSEDLEEKNIKALTDEQREAFLYQLGRRSKYYMYSLLMLNTGLRPGEALALECADIDLKRKKVTVNKTFLEKSQMVQYNTKTVSSRRSTPIPDNMIILLSEYMLMQHFKKPTDPLFQTDTGIRPSQSYLRKRFKFAGEKAGVPWVNLHTMRHTYASKLFKEKVDIKVISQLLGHKKVSTTYDIYVHFIDNVVCDSVQVLNV